MFVWEEGYKIGHPAMDSQHLVLFALLNQLDININHDMAESCITDVLSALASYIEFHFRHEENLMRKVEYPGLEDHMATHRVFVHELEVLSQVNGTCDPHKCALKVRGFVLDWLLNHILEVDADYSRHIAAQAAL